MAENKWHLVSTMETSDSLDVFCSFIGFTRDENENYVYMIKDAIEQGEEIEKENWCRVTIEDGKMEEYANGKWSELDSESSNDSSWKLPRCTAVWIFGRRGKYSASIYRDLKTLDEFSHIFDDEIGYLGNLQSLKYIVQENAENEDVIIEGIKSLIASLDDALRGDPSQPVSYIYFNIIRGRLENSDPPPPEFI